MTKLDFKEISEKDIPLWDPSNPKIYVKELNENHGTFINGKKIDDVYSRKIEIKGNKESINEVIKYLESCYEKNMWYSDANNVKEYEVKLIDIMRK